MRLAWAFRQLRRHSLRTGLAVSGIAVAAALLLDMVMLSGGMESSFEHMLLSRGFQIRLAPKGTLPFDTEATLGDARELVARLRRDPAIAAVGPVLATSVYARVRDSLLTLVGYGVDPLGQGIYQVTAGRDLARGDSLGLQVSRRTAARTGWRLGDTVTLLGRLDPQAAVAAVTRRFIVRGEADWLYDSRDDLSVGAAIESIQGLGRFPAGDRASLVMVKVRDDRAVDSVARRLAAGLPRVEVHSVAQLVRQFRTRLTYFRQLSVILSTISLLVAVLLVGTILTITVNERLGEIAALRAIGVSRPHVVAQVLAEGGLLTLSGAVLGLGLGLVTARYLDAILTSFPGLPTAIRFFVAQPVALARAGMTFLLTGTMAGTYPAWLAARAPIATTLRAEAE